MTFVKFAAVAIFIVAIIIAWTLVDFETLADRDRLRAIVGQSFVKGALLYVGAFVAIKFTFVPMTPMTIAGGYIFGGLWGAVLGTVAITLSSFLMFLLARALGENFVRATLEKKSERLSAYNEMIAKHGFFAVVFLRIIPIAPLAVVNFGLGVTKVRTIDFVMGTIIGTIPGNILLSFIGDNIDKIYSPQFVLLVLTYAMFVGASSWYAYRSRKR